MSTKKQTAKAASKPSPRVLPKSRKDKKEPAKPVKPSKEDIAKEKAKQEAESQKRGQLVLVAGKKGEALSNAVAHDMVKNFESTMKGKFTMDGKSMKVVRGYKPTEADFAEVMGSLLNLKGAASNAADAASFYLVDALQLAKQCGFDGDQLIEQVADEFGLSSFTAQQAQRLGEFFPPEKRIIGSNGKLLSMTHHKEIMDGAGAVKDPKKVQAVIDKVSEGKLIGTIKTKDGVEKPIIKNHSTKEVRAMMDEAAGKTPPPPRGAKGGAAGFPDANFLYIGSNEAQEEVVWYSKDLSSIALADDGVTVIDLATMTKLSRDGAKAYQLDPLPEKFFAEAFTVNVSIPEAKPEKPKKEPKTPKAPKPPKEKPAVEVEIEVVAQASSGIPD